MERRNSRGGSAVGCLAAIALAATGCGWDWDVKGAVADDAGGDGGDGGSACSGGTRFVTVAIAANEDDGQITGDGTVYPNGEDPAEEGAGIGIYPGVWFDGPSWGYFRFKLPGELSEATNIESAHIEVFGIGAIGVDFANPSSRYLSILLEDSVDAPVVSQSDDVPGEGRASVTGYSEWSFPNDADWRLSEWNSTSDVSALLETLAQTRGPIASGAHVQFWMVNNILGEAYKMEVGIADFSGAGATQAKLVLELTCP